MSDEKKLEIDRVGLPNPQATNPYYRGARMSDVARALMRPKDPKVREALARVRKESRARKGKKR